MSSGYKEIVRANRYRQPRLVDRKVRFTWWVRFQLDIDHPASSDLIQSFSYVLNTSCLDELVNRKFFPVANPPDFPVTPSRSLSWMIECLEDDCSPQFVTSYLKKNKPVPDDYSWTCRATGRGRLPG